jgi:hypothetical protein
MRRALSEVTCEGRRGPSTSRPSGACPSRRSRQWHSSSAQRRRRTWTRSRPSRSGSSLRLRSRATDSWTCFRDRRRHCSRGRVHRRSARGIGGDHCPVHMRGSAAASAPPRKDVPDRRRDGRRTGEAIQLFAVEKWRACFAAMIGMWNGAV